MKRVVLYTNCQGKAIREILACHPDMSTDYDLKNAIVIGNYELMNNQQEVPIDTIRDADLFIYQPISVDRGQYSTQVVLQHIKPGCTTQSFVYLYNYSFWETLVFADGDYDIGTFGIKYAALNHEPITSLRDSGISWAEIERRIHANTLDWKFRERYEKTQAILRENEKECTVKVADFIDANHKTQHLFYTQNHPTEHLLVFVAKSILANLGYDPEKLPPIDQLPRPHYKKTNASVSKFKFTIPARGYYGLKFGIAARKYYGFTFLPPIVPTDMNVVIDQAKRIYDGVYVNK